MAVVGADWAEWRRVGFFFRFFVFFVLALAPLLPVPFLLITDGPPLTMPCYACEMQESNGRGEGGVGWDGVGKVRTAVRSVCMHPHEHPPRKEPLTQ